MQPTHENSIVIIIITVAMMMMMMMMMLKVCITDLISRIDCRPLLAALLSLAGQQLILQPLDSTHDDDDDNHQRSTTNHQPQSTKSKQQSSSLLNSWYCKPLSRPTITIHHIAIQQGHSHHHHHGEVQPLIKISH